MSYVPKKQAVAIGQLVRSIAGRDHNHYYLVCGLDEDGRLLYLVDGIKRGLKNPKPKNVAHVQVVNKISHELAEKISDQSISAIPLEEIRRYLMQMDIDL